MAASEMSEWWRGATPGAAMALPDRTNPCQAGELLPFAAGAAPQTLPGSWGAGCEGWRAPGSSTWISFAVNKSLS